MKKQLCLLQWMLFLRTKRLVYVFACGILGIIFIPLLYINKYYASSLYTIMYFYYQLAIIGLILFLYMGYEVVAKSNDCNLHERLRASKNGLIYEYLSTHILLIALTVLYFLIALLVNLYFYYIYFDIRQNLYLTNLMKACTLYFLVLPIVAATFGMTIAGVCKAKRILSYLLILLFVILNTSFIDSVLFLPFNLLSGKTGTTMTNTLYEIKNIFTLTPHGLVEQYSADSLYGIPVEAARWFLALFWVSLSCFGIYFRKEHRSFKKPMSISLILAMCISLFSFTQKGSFPAMDMRPNGFVAQAFQQYGGQTQVISQSTDYSITKIFGTIHIRNQISVSLDIVLTDGPEGPEDEYVFTLYRGYNISKIVSNNKEIAFERDGDYFYISKKDVINNSFKINYEGFSPQFYSNRQGIVLPGYYPYYPMEGIKSIYNTTSQQFDISYPKTKRFFDVEVISSLPLISNLQQIGNRFQGESYTISLVGGNINLLDKQYLIYGSNTEIDKMTDKKDVFENDVNKNKLLAQDVPLELSDYLNGLHKMIIIPEVFNLAGAPASAFLGDHYINTLITWDGSLLESDIPVSRRTGFMRSFFISYMNNHDPESIEFWKASFPGYMDLSASDCIQKIDELKTIIDYDYIPNLGVVVNTLMPSLVYLIEHNPNSIKNIYDYLKSDHADSFGEIEFLKSELEALK